MVQWENPPAPSGHPLVDYAAVATELRNDPGRWAVVTDAGSANSAGQLARKIRRKQRAGFQVDGGDWETAVRGQRVYARWVPNL